MIGGLKDRHTQATPSQANRADETVVPGADDDGVAPAHGAILVVTGIGYAERVGLRVGILLFDGVDLLDAGGPYEVLLTASRLAARDGAPTPFEVVTLSIDGQTVRAYGGLGLIPHASVADAGQLDVLVVPGAIAIDDVLGDDRTVDAVRRLSSDAGLTSSVCTGAFILGAVGLLDGLPWTTHWEDVDALLGRLGAGAVRGVAWVDAGSVVTGGGLSSGIAMALHLVDRLADRDLAVRTARQLDYAWDADGEQGVTPDPGPTGTTRRRRP